MNRVALLWAAATCTASLTACCGGLALQQARIARLAFIDQMDRVTAPYRPSIAPERRRSSTSSGAAVTPLIRLERAFGFEREKRSKNVRPFLHVAAIAALPAGLTALLALKMFGEIATPVGLVVWLGLSRFYYSRRERRHAQMLFQQFPDALGMIVRAVRVGVPLNSAVRMVAEEGSEPTAAEFRQLGEEIAIGRSIGDALRAMSARNRLAEYRFFATALSLQSQTGGGLAETLETLADTIRKRVAARLRGHALASEARTSCYVLGALPFMVGLFLYVSNPSYMSVLFTTSVGLQLLGVAAALLSVGLYLMHLITKATLG